MSLLVDTNVISELARREPNPGVVAWSKTVTTIALSVISLEEICYGLALKPNARIQVWFDRFLREESQILPITDDIAHCGGQLRGSLSAQGQARTQADMLIAATAQIHQHTLVTRNLRDFQGCGIAVFNPFSE